MLRKSPGEQTLKRPEVFTTMARVLFWSILIFFCARVVIPQWNALRVSQHLQTLAPEWLLACGFTLLGHSLYLFALWGALLRLFGAKPRTRPLFRAYALSLLPKYVPGKVLAYGVRARLALDAGVEGAAVSASLVWEALFVLGSAVFLGGLGLLLPGPVFGREPVTWLVIGFVIAAVVFGLAGSTQVLGSKWKEWVGIPQVRARPVAAGALFGLYASTWLTYALAHWFLILAVAPGRVVPLASLAIAVAVSWGVGFVSVIAPGGLGVRESALYVFVSTWLSASEALLFVTLSRAVSLVVEAALAGAWGVMALTSARRDAAGT